MNLTMAIMIDSPNANKLNKQTEILTSLNEPNRTARRREKKRPTLSKETYYKHI